MTFNLSVNRQGQGDKVHWGVQVVVDREYIMMAFGVPTKYRFPAYIRIGVLNIVVCLVVLLLKLLAVIMDCTNRQVLFAINRTVDEA